MREGARNNAEAVRRNGVKFCYAENWIYAPPIEKMRRLIAASKGSILELHAEENHSGSVYAPIERFGTPEELASFFVFLCSKRASYSVGSTYFVDGGMPRTTS